MTSILRTTLFAFFLLSFSAFAQVAQEEVFVPNYNRALMRKLVSYPQLTVDHASPKGFELYGPKGLKQWLQENNIAFIDMAQNRTEKSEYPSYEEVTARLKNLAASYPHIFKLFSIGQSHEGRELWVMKVSDNVHQDEIEPEVKYISSMHGDEITGRELMLILLQEIGQKYGVDRKISHLVNNTEMFIMPSMNPDGSTHQRRGNGAYVDLNRNFPDVFSNQRYYQDRQPETLAVMNFQASRQFALSANFHGGAVVVNYPWDSTYDRHPFDELVQDVSLEYAKRNPEMKNSTLFKDGITNGADWYIVRGGMQDWSYTFFNDLQVTVELSQQKWPDYSMIPGYYQRNRDSLFKYLSSVHQGAGFVLNRPNMNGIVEVFNRQGNSLGKYKFRNSEFYKVLDEGDYIFQISYGQVQKQIQMTVTRDYIRDGGNYVVVD